MKIDSVDARKRCFLYEHVLKSLHFFEFFMKTKNYPLFKKHYTPINVSDIQCSVVFVTFSASKMLYGSFMEVALVEPLLSWVIKVTI